MNPQPDKINFLWKIRVLFVYFICAILDLGFSIYAIGVYLIFYNAPKLRFEIISASMRLMMRMLFLRIIPALGLYKIKISGCKIGSIQNGKTIFVANHTSWLDPFIMLALVPRAGILLKAKYARRSIAILTKIFDFIYVKEGDVNSANAVLERARNVILKGENLIVFPEGKRGLNGRLGDFKKLAFKLSKDTNAPIAPICIHFNSIILGKRDNDFYLKQGVEISVEILPQLNPSDFKDVDSLSARVYCDISKAVAKYKK